MNRWLIGALAVAICAAGAAVAFSSGSRARMATTASASHLRVVVRSTSDWTELRVHTGQLEAQHISTTTGNAQWRVEGFGLAMTGGSGQLTTVTDDVVLYDPHDDQGFVFTLLKGSRGTASFSLARCAGSRCGAGDTYTDSRDTATDPSNSQSFVLPRSGVMTETTPILPRADDRRLVLADYYPWWPNYDAPRLADHPSDRRSTDSLSDVQSMTAQAKANGINGFVVSWDGQQGHGPQFQLALRAAEAQGQLVTGYLESHQAAQTASAVITTFRWLAQLLSYSSSSAFLKSGDGVPVVFVFDMEALTPSQWGAVLNTLKSTYGYSVDLVGDANLPTYWRYEWGFARYDANAGIRSLRQYDLLTSLQAKARSVVNPEVAPKAFVGTVSPGFDDHRLRGDRNPVVPRAAGRRYLETWNAALSSQPDWVLVTSWNEWYEDTEVEPGVKSGDEALKETAEEAARWRR